MQTLKKSFYLYLAIAYVDVNVHCTNARALFAGLMHNYVAACLRPALC